jgi:hypothetical protein
MYRRLRRRRRRRRCCCCCCCCGDRDWSRLFDVDDREVVQNDWEKKQPRPRPSNEEVGICLLNIRTRPSNQVSFHC